MELNEAMAMAIMTPFLTTRLPMRSTASSTVAMTAGLSPKKTACTTSVC